ncbi:TonB-dependent receptor plug domain-containing protein [Sphingomonas panni]
MNQSTSRLRSGVARSAVVIAALMASASAVAQTAAPGNSDNVPIPADPAAQTPADASNGEEIVVTGTRIRRPDFESPSPVVSVSGAAIQQGGSTNLTDIIAQIPALQGSTTSADTAGSGVGIGLSGLNLLNLRNLGEDRTLVLIDGRRQVASLPGSQAVDVSTIPTDLLERVDVLTGGVSAVYGADAVTGVVNFVLKRNFEGITARAQAGISEYGDAGKRLLAVTAGKNFADGRGNVALAYEYGSESRLESRDRARLRGTGFVSFQRNPNDPEFQPGYTGGASNGIPDNIPTNDVRYNDTARQGGIDVDFDGQPDYFVNGAGQLVPFQLGTVLRPGFSQGKRHQCRRLPERPAAAYRPPCREPDRALRRVARADAVRGRQVRP